MVLQHLFPSSKTNYENQIEKVAKSEQSELDTLQASIKRMSKTSILFGIFMITFNIIKNITYIKAGEFASFYQVFFLTSGLWSIIVSLQILTLLLCSTFFQNLTYLLLNRFVKYKDNWNSFCTGILLTNVLSYSILSILSFYGVLSFLINSKDPFQNMQTGITALFSLSMNLVFVELQMIYLFLKIYQIKKINLHRYFPILLPGFAIMLELLEHKLINKIREKLLLNKKSKKQKKIMDDNLKHDEDHLFLVE